MDEILTFSLDEAAPDRTAVLAGQGIPPGHAVAERIDVLYAAASALLAAAARPRGVLLEISAAGFAAVHAGEGASAAATPVGAIHGRAEHLALFAVTLGEEVSREIARRFAAHDLALAVMLDAAASVAADNLAGLIEQRYAAALADAGALPATSAVLRYSPGYCGWHVSGQRRLFAALRPERIGISLGSSCLMQPLKSVSGVLIAGPREIHLFSDSYPCCDECATHDCRERQRALAAGRAGGAEQGAQEQGPAGPRSSQWTW